MSELTHHARSATRRRPDHARTQTARYLDAAGTVVMAPGHGTSSGTNPPTGTTGKVTATATRPTATRGTTPTSDNRSPSGTGRHQP
ncbi:hypothetical protein SCWH03_30570 [Streptomyces pacificus]|uniref:Uncharacterized protein n=1 Tax=Streptomyces pacificus TaxID=2705029 RepID=A0A6A0AXX3_9ACTN|nr:hypothetical protein SCWH03_30570 [Streptomyces pacificus]